MNLNEIESKLRAFGLKVLSGKELTEKQLTDRLRTWMKRVDPDKFFPHETIIQNVLDELRQDGVVSNDRAAAAWIRHYTRRGKGAKHIRQKLGEKGVKKDSTEIQEVISQSFDQTEADLVFGVLERRYPDANRDLKAKARAVRGLQQRGFSSDAIFLALKRLAATPGSDTLD